MKRTPPALFNKEKFIFLFAALAFSAALYRAIATQPLLIESTAPLASLTVAGVPRVAESQNESTHPQLDVPADGLRSPFAPRSYRHPLPRPIKIPDDMLGNWGPQPPSSGVQTNGNLPLKPFNPREAGLEYIGVVMLDEKACALLRTRDSSAPQRVTIGEKIAGLDCRVTRIERQAVWLSDGTSTSVLRNERFVEPQPDVKPVKKDSRPSVFF
jgi:hypothetical protein